MIADKFKITPTGANGTYETLLSVQEGRPATAEGRPRLPGPIAAGAPFARRPRPAEVPGFFHATWTEMAV